MVKKNSKKKKICLEISEDLYRALHQAILDIYGSVFGHIGATVENCIEFWLNYKP